MSKAHSLVLLLLCVVPSALSKSSIDWEKVHNLTLHGINQLYNLEMDNAERTFDEVIRSAPSDPRGYFFKGMIYFWTYTLNKDERAYDQFFELSDNVIAICEKELDQDDRNALAMFYLGGTYGYRGLAYQRNGSLLNAARDGRRGYFYLKDATDLKPDLHDAQMGFGLFSYLVGKVPKSYRWLLNALGFTGDVEGGLIALRQAAEKGTYTRSEASFYLAEFLFAENRRDEASVHLKHLLEKHPENTLFLSQYAQWEYRQDRIEPAMEAARTAIAISKKKKTQIGDEFAYSVLANCYFVKNDFAAARDHAELYLKKVQDKEIVPNSMYYRLGVSYDILGQREKAITTYKQMRDVEYGMGGEWNRRLFRRGQVRLQRPFTEADILLVKAENAAAFKDTEAAARIYKQILEKHLDDDERASALYGLTQVQYDRQEYQDIVTTAQQLVALRPLREKWLVPHGYYRLGQAYAKLGLANEARRAFEEIEKYSGYDFQARLESRVEDELQKLDRLN